MSVLAEMYFEELKQARSRIAALEAMGTSESARLSQLLIAANEATKQAVAELDAENHDLSARITASGVRSREDEAYDSGYQAAKADDEQLVYKAEAELAVASELIEELDPHHLKRNQMGMRQQREGDE